MKKFGLGLMIFLVLLSLIGSVNLASISFDLQLSSIRKSVKNTIKMNLAPSDLKDFHFTLAELDSDLLEWEHSREFKLQGRMYDVVYADTCENEVYFLCFADNEESLFRYNFKEKLADALAKNSTSKDYFSHFQNFFSALVWQKENAFLSNSKLTNKYILFNHPTSAQFKASIVLPPPNILLF